VDLHPEGIPLLVSLQDLRIPQAGFLGDLTNHFTFAPGRDQAEAFGLQALVPDLHRRAQGAEVVDLAGDGGFGQPQGVHRPTPHEAAVEGLEELHQQVEALPVDAGGERVTGQDRQLTPGFPLEERHHHGSEGGGRGDAEHFDLGRRVRRRGEIESPGARSPEVPFPVAPPEPQPEEGGSGIDHRQIEHQRGSSSDRFPPGGARRRGTGRQRGGSEEIRLLAAADEPAQGSRQQGHPEAGAPSKRRPPVPEG